MVRALAAVAIAAALIGCGGADRPDPAGDTADVETDELHANPSRLSDEEVVRARGTQEVCRPGYTRDCKIFFIDKWGIPNCPTLTEVCRPDGTGFFACGEIIPEPGPF